MLHEVGAAVAGTDGRLPATSNLTVNLSERVSAWGLLGYGLGGPWDVGVATPYGGLALSEAGWRTRRTDIVLAARSGRQPWHRGNEAPIGLHSEFLTCHTQRICFQNTEPSQNQFTPRHLAISGFCGMLQTIKNGTMHLTNVD